VTWGYQQTTSLGLKKTVPKIAENKHKPKRTTRVTFSHKLVLGISTEDILTISQHCSVCQIFLDCYIFTQ
jgi:hypothetical protein